MIRPVVIALALASLAIGSSARSGPQSGTVGVFADPAGTEASLQWLRYVPVRLYVVASDLDGGVGGFEYGLTAPPTMLVFGPDQENGAPSFLGPNPANAGDSLNAIVETGGCVEGSGPVVLATYDVLFTYEHFPYDEICIGPADPSSIVPAAPAYTQCDATVVGLDGGGTCLRAIPIILRDPVVESSFSAVKARF
jgi:hypothetical protein